MKLIRLAVAVTAVIAAPALLPAPASASSDLASVTGRITDHSGAAADATVTVEAVDGSFTASADTWTLGDGNYRIDDVPTGDYRISFYDNTHGTQWIPGRESAEEAEVFPVSAGRTLVVEDSWLPLGAVRVAVEDAVTGAPVPEPCVSVHSTPAEVRACGTNGVVELDGVPPGDWEVSVSAGASYFTPEQNSSVTVARDATANLSVALEPGAAVRTRAVDAVTGDPLSRICVRTVDAVWPGISANMHQYCSGEDGTIEIGPFAEEWTVNLYAFQSVNRFDPPAVRYGDQWAGAAGGSGDQRQARAVTFEPRVSKTVPDIRMDQPGTITGTVLDTTTGQPVGGVCAFPYATVPFAGTPTGAHCSTAQGRYTIANLGPYAWPVQFAPTLNRGYAWQWSGDAADRTAATYVPVTVGGTATADAHLIPGGKISGTTSDGATPVSGVLVTAYHATTHDYAGPTWDYSDSAGAFDLPGHRTQQLLVNFTAAGRDCWYGTGTGAATPVPVTAGSTTRLPIDTSANCAPKP